MLAFMGSPNLKWKSYLNCKMVYKIPDLIMDYFFAESENYKDLKVIMHFLLIACKYKFSRSIMNYEVFRKTFYSVQNIISANAKANCSKQIKFQFARFSMSMYQYLVVKKLCFNVFVLVTRNSSESCNNHSEISLTSISWFYGSHNYGKIG